MRMAVGRLANDAQAPATYGRDWRCLVHHVRKMHHHPKTTIHPNCFDMMSKRQDETLSILAWLLDNPDHIEAGDTFQIEFTYLADNGRSIGGPGEKLKDDARLALALARGITRLIDTRDSSSNA